jgi:eukaryotic-like serine/threonine-protein kinase
MPGSAVSDLAGRVLAGRYLLHAAVGTGASGRVYVAEDTRLKRRVAVKVLHAALAEDAAFLRRFRAEAQLAASLHHPHIVTVHDWGDDDVPFMVLELLEGGSLRSMLDQENLLTVSQAARVGRDVASALEYAHARGVLHRDIKPANLLFDEHGIVRVADFGLARALAEASWTEPAGAVFGTARYASPEQAKGAQLDARSDLYSLALVLVESVTGRLPFAADTTLGMLTARTLEPIVASEGLGPLESVIDRVGAIDPNDRYPDAATMRQAISDAADALPPPGPLLLAGMVDKADPHPTRAVPERAAPFFDQDAVDSGRNAAVTTKTTKQVAEPATEVVRARPPGERRLVPWIVGIVMILVVGLAAAALAQVGTGKQFSVPGLRGLSLDQATLAAKNQGFTVRATNRTAPDPPGTVIEQSPAAGDFTSGHRVQLVVSSGPANVTIPSIVNAPWATAKRELDTAGLIYPANPPTQPNELIAKGSVVRIKPDPGASVPPDQAVQVVLSSGHAPRKVPDVTRFLFDAASTALTKQHFKVERVPDQFSSTVPAGRVIRTGPKAGVEAPYDSTVGVLVSKGPDLVKVPNVFNLTVTDAADYLASFGFQTAVGGSFKPKDRVGSQHPVAGAEAPRNSTVTIYR